MSETVYCYICLGCNLLHEKDKPLDPKEEICERPKCGFPLKRFGRVVSGKWTEGEDWPEDMPAEEEQPIHKLKLL